MATSIPGSVTHAFASAVKPLTGAPADFDDVLAMAGDRQFCLIGEASHGTHEFYRIRAEITKRLIAEHGFAAVAVEADWPDAYRVIRYVRGGGSDGDAEASLRGFQRFPQWMWRNADVLDFVGWLRAHNEAHPDRQAGFYGLDLYSLHASIEAVLTYLRKVDPQAAARAARRYACFDHVSGGPQEYGYHASINPPLSCERDVVDQLVELRARATDYIESTALLERAIGVIYRPETERLSHYFRARLASQFDAVFHYDRTRAVEPLDRTAHWESGEPELPETYPTAL